MAHNGVRGGAFVAADLTTWLAVLGSSLWRLQAGASLSRRNPVLQTAIPVRAPMTAAARVSCALFVTVAAVALGTVVTEYLAAPHGQWDAWAMWNQKARFLFRAGSQWTQSLALPWSNPSHPLLVSTSVARLWSYAGAELTAVPAMLGLSLGIGIAAAVIGALDPARSRAWLAGAVVIAPSTFVELVAAQTSDLPMGFFVVASLVTFFDVRSQPSTAWTLAGGSLLLGATLAGFAAWTKNEGLVLVGLIGLTAAWISLRQRDVRPLLWAAGGAIPALISIAWLKFEMMRVPPGYFSESDTIWTLFDRMFSPERHDLVASIVVEHWTQWGGVGAQGMLPLVTGAAALAAVMRGGAPRTLGAVTAAMFLAYYASFVVSSLDTTWLVTTTIDRLIVQLWPALVVACFSYRPIAGTRALNPGPFAGATVRSDNSAA
jgi:hypothetical protein